MPSFVVSLLILAGAQAAPPEQAAPSEEITVVARKLRDWRGNASKRDGVTRCVTRRSTGDAEIDAIGCRALTDCMPRFEPEILAVANSTAKRAERERLNAPIYQRMGVCFAERRETLVRELADRRAAGG
ncbi:hypothetical protein [Sphingomonas sp. VNH70]|uniref:hypothetical protein n=1 Tax=Sphingomonas silueang TaxID=3156617 RepID=UPI0032B380E8